MSAKEKSNKPLDWDSVDCHEEKEPCRIDLTPEELIECGRELASSQRELHEIADDFKGVRDEWKARISAVEARITTLANRIGRGYDIRPIPCMIVFDQPEAGVKTCYRKETGERVWVRDMTESDKQRVLDLQEEAEATDPPDQYEESGKPEPEPVEDAVKRRDF